MRNGNCFPAIVFVLACTAAPVFAANAAAIPANNAPPLQRQTGTEIPDLAALDQLMAYVMHKHHFPGGALAVAKDGRLVFARGYGLAEPGGSEPGSGELGGGKPVEPDSLFRIASLSKPITSAVVLKLVEAGKLDLDAKAFELLGKIAPPQGTKLDPRWRRITVRQLLQHTAGFNSKKSLDPMLCSLRIARDLGIPSPPDQKAIISFMLGRLLDDDPGTHYAYSNFGFCVLGRIIETVSGKSYEEAAKSLVLSPAGITRMRLGGTRLSERLPGEVIYQASRGEPPCESVFSDVHEKVAAPYALYHIGAMDSHGGWVASAVDLVRFATAADGSRKPGILKPESIQLLESPPASPLPTDPHHYYGLGWSIATLDHTLDHGADWQHCGRLAGSASMLVRLQSGVCWAAVFNSNSDDAVYGELNHAMQAALNDFKRWPKEDQFSMFP